MLKNQQTDVDKSDREYVGSFKIGGMMNCKARFSSAIELYDGQKITG